MPNTKDTTLTLKPSLEETLSNHMQLLMKHIRRLAGYYLILGMMKMRLTKVEERRFKSEIKDLGANF